MGTPTGFEVCDGSGEDKSCFGSDLWPDRVPMPHHHLNYFGRGWLEGVCTSGPMGEWVAGSAAHSVADINAESGDYILVVTMSTPMICLFVVFGLLLTALIAFNIYQCVMKNQGRTKYQIVKSGSDTEIDEYSV